MKTVYMIVCASESMAAHFLTTVLKKANGMWCSAKPMAVPDIRDDDVFTKNYPKGYVRKIVGVAVHMIDIKPGDDVLIRIGPTGNKGWSILFDEEVKK